MNALLSILAALLLPAVQEEVSPPESVARIYDLAALAVDDWPESRLEGEYDLQRFGGPLLPVLDPVNPFRGHNQAETDGQDDGSRLLDLIVGMREGEFEFEGRSAQLLGDGRVVLRGPESLHAFVGTALDALGGILGAETEITVDFVRVPAGRELPERVVVSAEAAGTWLEGVGDSRRTVRVRLRADRWKELAFTRVRPLVLTHEVVVASGSYGHGPSVVLASIGTELALAVSPRRDGVDLALVLRRGDPEGEVRERELGGHGRVTTEASVSSSRSPGKVQSVRIRNRSLALSSFLPDGRALFVSTELASGEGPMREVVVIRRTGDDLPLAADLPAGSTRAGLALNPSFLFPCRTAATGHLLLSPEPFAHLLMPWGEGNFLREEERPLWAKLVAGGPSGEELARLLAETLGAGRELDVEWLGPFAFVFSPEGSLQELRSRLASMASAPTAMEISVELRRGADVLAEARLPAVSGRSSSVVLGRETPYVFDFDVSIATDSVAPEPWLMTGFEGLAVWMKPRTTPSGDVLLDVRGGAAALLSEDPFELNGPLMSTLDQPVYDQLVFSEPLRLERGGTGGSVVLGPEGGAPAGAPGGLSLVVRVLR